MKGTPLGRELKRLRTEKGLTVRELAARLGKSAGYVGRIEAMGEIPNAEFLCELARVFEAEPERFLDLAKRSLISQVERDIDMRHARALESQVERDPELRATRRGKEGRRMATVVSLINMKGGVGKTTLAMQLAHAADQADMKVLAIDLDPQSNLSQAVMRPRMYAQHIQSQKPTVVQILDEYVPSGPKTGGPQKLDLEDVILKKAGYWQDTTLDLIPSRLELSRTLKNPHGKERRLAKALAQVSDQYDLVIIDCAPTESVLTEAAYFASRYLVVPIKPEFMATIGLPLLARSLQEFQLENDDHEIEIAGLVFNHSSTYTSGPEGQRAIKEVTDIAEENEWRVCENQMRYSASYAKSAREGTPIGNTSHVRGGVISGFDDLKDEIFGILGLGGAAT